MFLLVIRLLIKFVLWIKGYSEEAKLSDSSSASFVPKADYILRYRGSRYYSEITIFCDDL